jgi:hypothetical protein
VKYDYSNIRYYAALEYCKDSKETPKYVIKAQAGDYPPMEELKSRDRRVYMYLMEKGHIFRLSGYK